MGRPWSRRLGSVVPGGGRRGASVPSSGLATGTALLDWTAAVYGHASSGFYVESASSVPEFAIDVMRLGSRGLLCERGESWPVGRPIYLDGSWSAILGTPTSTLVAGSDTAGSAPNGGTPAHVTLGAGTTADLTQTIPVGYVADHGNVAMQLFLKGIAGGETLKNRLTDKSSVNREQVLNALTTSWTRQVQIVLDVGSGTNQIQRLLNLSAAVVMDFYAWGLCMNIGRYPLAPYRAGAAPGTSQPDQCQFLSASIPLALRSGNVDWSFTPEWAPADLVSGDERWIFSSLSPDGYRVRHNGTDVRVEAVIGGSVVASSGALTGSTREVRRTLNFRPATGLVGIDSVYGSAGTPWTLEAGVSYRVGGKMSASGEADAYIEIPVVA